MQPGESADGSADFITEAEGTQTVVREDEVCTGASGVWRPRSSRCGCSEKSSADALRPGSSPEGTHGSYRHEMVEGLRLSTLAHLSAALTVNLYNPDVRLSRRFTCRAMAEVSDSPRHRHDLRSSTKCTRLSLGAGHVHTPPFESSYHRDIRSSHLLLHVGSADFCSPSAPHLEISWRCPVSSVPGHVGCWKRTENDNWRTALKLGTPGQRLIYTRRQPAADVSSWDVLC